jgi:hypothetical protein
VAVIAPALTHPPELLRKAGSWYGTVTAPAAVAPDIVSTHTVGLVSVTPMQCWALLVHPGKTPL